MNTRGRLVILFSIMISLCCRAGDKPDQSGATRDEAFVPDTEWRGVIDDPSGYVRVLADKQSGAAIMANVKTGERVSFERKEGDKWCKVTSPSGKSGWVPSNRIKLYVTMKDLPRKGGELGAANCNLARRAASGDYDALGKFLNLKLDGVGAEEADEVLEKLFTSLATMRVFQF